LAGHWCPFHPSKPNLRRDCTGTRASTHRVTTCYRSNSARIDLETCEITTFFGIRPGCPTNDHLYPANGVMNMPNLTAGCTCNFAPASVACVPAGVGGGLGVKRCVAGNPSPPRALTVRRGGWWYQEFLGKRPFGD
jgi:hypothetical protein